MAARHDAVVAPLVRQVAASNEDRHPVADPATPMPTDPPTLLQRYPDAAALRAVTNGRRTSTVAESKGRGGAAYAHILTNHGAVDLAGVDDLMIEPQRWTDTNRALAARADSPTTDCY
jgi:hypothetical protein